MDLAGRVVAMVDNTKEQGTLILEAIAAALKERHGVARVIIRSKEHYSKPATDQLIDELAQEAHLAVAAVGG
jgi:chorismate mutase